jgi:hypothetical protein
LIIQLANNFKFSFIIFMTIKRKQSIEVNLLWFASKVGNYMQSIRTYSALGRSSELILHLDLITTPWRLTWRTAYCDKRDEILASMFSRSKIIIIVYGFAKSYLDYVYLIEHIPIDFLLWWKWMAFHEFLFHMWDIYLCKKTWFCVDFLFFNSLTKRFLLDKSTTCNQ